MIGKKLLNQHKEKFFSCSRCPLHRIAFKQVIFRGSLPCDVLFLGESPSNTDDIVGEPFMGQAGTILNALIDSSQESNGKYSFGISNILCCISKDDENAPKQLVKEEVKECRPRLIDIVEKANPKVIVFLGKVVQKHFPIQDMDLTNKSILLLQNPVYILHKGGIGSLEYKRNNLDLIEGTKSYAKTKTECSKKKKCIKSKSVKKFIKKSRKEKKAIK